MKGFVSTIDIRRQYLHRYVTKQAFVTAWQTQEWLHIHAYVSYCRKEELTRSKQHYDYLLNTLVSFKMICPSASIMSL